MAGIDSLGAIIEAELPQYGGAESFEVPLVGMRVLAGELSDQRGHDIVADTHDVFLLVFAFEKLFSDAINRFALLVHHVVVFEDVFARREILAFHALLSAFDLLGDKPRFDGYAFLHAEPLHDSRDAFCREDAHQIIFERDIETRRPRIALTSGASAKLIVDAPGLVALRADDVQAADPDDFLVFLVSLRFYLREGYAPLVGRRLGRIDIALAQHVTSKEVGITA